MACLLKQHANDGKKLAFIAGGETIVHVKGNGLGGRNQELALAAAIEIAGLPNVALLSIGSDGTDGPTDAAGGFVDGSTYHDLREKGQSPEAYLTDNDAYHALQAVDCLIKTGPTGTNVNDLVVGLILP
jgi:hydroxypyruvate reductase